MERRLFLAALPSLAFAQGITLHNVEATSATLKSKTCQRLSAGPNAAGGGPNRLDHLALLDGVEFSNGTIEVDIAGEPASSGAAGAGARGFVGVAFRVQPDRKTYDCFYIRPTNGRAEDQERRNHAVQYISHPTYTWSKLRQETPSRYEAYADMVPAEWVHLKIEVDGLKAKLFVNGATQPTLLVNDLKSGPNAKGRVAIWFEGSTIAHFANLKVTPR
jgi:hypothetical protein